MYCAAAMQTSEELRKWLLGELLAQPQDKTRLIILDNAEDALVRPPANTQSDEVDSTGRDVTQFTYSAIPLHSSMDDAQQDAVWKLFIEVR